MTLVDVETGNTSQMSFHNLHVSLPSTSNQLLKDSGLLNEGGSDRLLQVNR